MKKKIVISTVLALLLTGCADQVPTLDDAVSSIKSGDANTKSPKHYAGKSSSQKVNDGWIRKFRDPTLNSLVTEAQKNNFDLKAAKNRVARSEALTRLAGSQLKPTVGLGVMYDDEHYSPADNITIGGLVASWEPDVWGRVQNVVASQAELSEATLSDYNFARQSLAANTAKAWFTLNANNETYRFYTDLVGIQKRALKIITAREEIGQGDKRDVHVSRALVADAKENAALALTSKENSQRALEVLIGRYPSAALRAKKLSAVPPRIPAGLPSELLERRPDMIAAEYRVAAAFHKKEAKDLLYMPSINLNVALGPNSVNNMIGSLIAGVIAPVYTGGAIEAEIDIATAEQNATIEAYRQNALIAFQEVENALASEKYLASRYKYSKTMAFEYKAAYDMTVKKYDVGQSTVLEILLIQGKWVAAEIIKVDVAKSRLINRVNLHLALGGSFK